MSGFAVATSRHGKLSPSSSVHVFHPPSPVSSLTTSKPADLPIHPTLNSKLIINQVLPSTTLQINDSSNATVPPSSRIKYTVATYSYYRSMKDCHEFLFTLQINWHSLDEFFRFLSNSTNLKTNSHNLTQKSKLPKKCLNGHRSTQLQLNEKQNKIKYKRSLQWWVQLDNIKSGWINQYQWKVHHQEVEDSRGAFIPVFAVLTTRNLKQVTIIKNIIRLQLFIFYIWNSQSN